MFENIRKKRYIPIPGRGKDVNSEVNSKDDSKGYEEAVARPQNKVRPCKKCGAAITGREVRENYYICPYCGGYYRVHAYRRIEMLIDKGTFEEWNREMPIVDPLDFPDYETKVEQAREKTDLNEAVITGRGKINGYDVVIGVCDNRYLMSSMGHNMGEKIALAVERATKERLPVLIYAASGGARMQEGMISLMQMAKTSAALKRHSEAGLLYISFLTEPTTGGVTASFAMLGDIILAEPGALIGFAGPRVIEQTIGQKLPEGFQRAEFQLEHGFVDEILERKDQKEYLANILRLHSTQNGWKHWTDAGTAKPPVSEIFAEAATNIGLSEEEKPKSRKAPFSGLMSQKVLDKITGRHRDAWNVVHQSRKVGRPTSISYIEELFDDFTEFHGDRYFGDDKAVIGGIASYHGMPVTVIGQERGRDSQDSIQRRFGMSSPEGYRKALRLMKQAEKFNRPIICFVDTPGAYPGMEAEERGQGEAIARNLYEMSDLKVPILSLIIGQGGSGGALALAVANEVWMMENATYSILSPEGFASILWKDAKKADEAVKVMKITAEDLYKLGTIERIIVEDEPATADNIAQICEIIDTHMRSFFGTCAHKTPEELVSQRYDRFRKC
ncbi:MAG: acetyl-CoA carboxylase carboxyltransferase subunit alpha [Clostridiales bacterium]|nr:acetyl-CoA carboxylase carboxyltransferase subunit alpha [Clostridiales bacterium]